MEPNKSWKSIFWHYFPQKNAYPWSEKDPPPPPQTPFDTCGQILTRLDPRFDLWFEAFGIMQICWQGWYYPYVINVF
jgi:hypothetical protein